MGNIVTVLDLDKVSIKYFDAIDEFMSSFISSIVFFERWKKDIDYYIELRDFYISNIKNNDEWLLRSLRHFGSKEKNIFRLVTEVIKSSNTNTIDIISEMILDHYIHKKKLIFEGLNKMYLFLKRIANMYVIGDIKYSEIEGFLHKQYLEFEDQILLHKTSNLNIIDL